MTIDYHSDTGHWTHNKPIPLNTYGFIYCIENITNNKKYIGKKQMLTTVKKKPLKGKKNKRHETKSTNWKEYTSSSNELNEDIIRLGKDKFNFKILMLCDSKWELSYQEAKLQFEQNVLLNENYYNGIINLRLGKKK
jgi:hypothetical protein